jgi:hypothetical protein
MSNAWRKNANFAKVKKRVERIQKHDAMILTDDDCFLAGTPSESPQNSENPV